MLKLAVAGLVLTVAIPALAQTPEIRRPAVRAATPIDTSLRPRPDPIADRARRDADERQKRWDARMSRVTRSLCVGC